MDTHVLRFSLVGWNHGITRQHHPCSKFSFACCPTLSEKYRTTHIQVNSSLPLSFWTPAISNGNVGFYLSIDHDVNHGLPCQTCNQWRFRIASLSPTNQFPYTVNFHCEYQRLDYLRIPKVGL
jgi:hypothetical protein